MQDVKRKIEYYFRNLHFNEDKHLYTINKDNNDKKILPSVSGLIKRYAKPFPKDASNKYAIKNNLTVQQVKKEWKNKSDEACERGTRVHLFGELYPFDKTVKPKCKQEEACKKFWDELPEHIEPLIMELRMYHKEYDYAGTTDIVLYNRLNNTVILADYKTNKDLFKNFKQKRLLKPFSNLLDCPFNKYQLQLSYYQILLEQSGFKVSSRKLIWLRKTGEYEMYSLDELTDTLEDELKLAK